MYAGTDSCLYREYDEQGILISGGEAQKLAIAKALYKDAPVFIMDEPSAALNNCLGWAASTRSCGKPRRYIIRRYIEIRLTVC